MPAFLHRHVQTDETEGRQFITIKDGSNERVVYLKVYLCTADPAATRRRARSLDEIENVEEARRIIARLASSNSPREERTRLSELSDKNALI